MAKNFILQTSRDKEHSHSFMIGDKVTSKDSGHTHPINYGKGLAIATKSVRHSHRLPKFLLNQIDKGVRIELLDKHTKSKGIAMGISLHHLSDNHLYYSRASVRGNNRLVTTKG